MTVIVIHCESGCSERIARVFSETLFSRAVSKVTYDEVHVYVWTTLSRDNLNAIIGRIKN